MIYSVTNVAPILVSGKPSVDICVIQKHKKYIFIGDNIITDGKLAENLKIPFFHKTLINDLHVLFMKLKLSLTPLKV